MIGYLRALTLPRTILWCYFIWWLGAAVPYFDQSPALWLTSIGIALIIGTGLLLSTAYAGPTVIQLHPTVIVRLYLMPFFVSSFAALIKDRGFFVVFHPDWLGNVRPLGACALWVGLIVVAKKLRSPRPALDPEPGPITSRTTSR